jgi:CheY-like chemotaxis protein
MHILLIDDSSSTRSLLRTLINSGQSVRHEISEAASGEEALQKVGSGEINLPNLIIMDINMGGMSGYELCREFRQKYGTASDVVPYIIIVTANEGVDVINEALDCGANDYMPKPVNVKILHIRLRVAERLLAHAQTGGITGSGRVVLDPDADKTATSADGAPKTAEPAPEVDPLQSLVASSVEYADAPIAILEVGGDKPAFSIVYANAAMAAMTQLSQEELAGKSLSELEAWTSEFISMVLSFIERGAIVSYVPLWSETRQAVPVHLSFYPIRAGDQPVNHYLVIHHF